MPLKLQHDEMPALNLTSMIDILFLLIIFFMVATKFDELERNIQVAVPQVAKADERESPPKPLVVTVDSNGEIDLDGTPVTFEELTARLSAARTAAGPSVVPRSGNLGAGHHRAHRRAGQCARSLRRGRLNSKRAST
jgi:biopolymer transport protein ExbD